MCIHNIHTSITRLIRLFVYCSALSVHAQQLREYPALPAQILIWFLVNAYIGRYIQQDSLSRIAEVSPRLNYFTLPYLSYS